MFYPVMLLFKSIKMTKETAYDFKFNEIQQTSWWQNDDPSTFLSFDNYTKMKTDMIKCRFMSSTNMDPNYVEQA